VALFLRACGYPIIERIPSAALLLRQIRFGDFVEAAVPVVGMAGDEAILGPPGEGLLMNVETRRRFLFRQHSSLPQAIMARSKLILVDEIGDPQRREAGILATAARSFARAVPLPVEDVGDLGIDVIVEEFVDEFDNAGLRLDLLGGRLRVQGGDRLELAALEANMDLGRSFLLQLDESGILDDVGEQPLAFAV